VKRLFRYIIEALIGTPDVQRHRRMMKGDSE